MNADAVPAIRLARADDADAIARVHVETWQHAYRGILPAAYLAALSVDERRAMWLASIERGTPAVFVAEAAGQVAGFAAVGPCRDKDGVPGSFEIWAIYAAPAFWGRGIGRGLCAAARELAQSKEAPRLTLWVIADNQPAQRFYQRVGFELDAASRQPFALGGITLDELRFVQTL